MRVKNKKRRKKINALPKKERLNGRIFGVGVSMCVIFGLLGLEVVKLTLFKHEEYTVGALANMNQSESMVEAPRGTIQDRNGKSLAVSLLTYNVILSPYQIVNNVKPEAQVELYTQLEAATGVAASEIKGTVEEKIANNPNSQWYQLATKIELTEEQVEALDQLGGVDIQKTYKRNYPNGELAAQVLGFYNKNEEGQYGVEEGYEHYLLGQPGRAYSQFQDGGIVTREYQEPKSGATVKLTIDQVVQQYVEETMEKYIKDFNPSKASCIIMDPNTGEILSMYSYPSFDPNTYNNLSVQLGKNVWASMKQEKQTQALFAAWKNNGIQYIYEPGSTFKPLVVAMALQEGVISETDTYECSGYKKVADRTIHCWKTAGHGHQTLGEALANSCNVAMMDIAEQMDNEVFLHYLSDFGFGEKTGIELAGEESGILHTSLGPVEKATYSIGQTFMVTPIQLITAFSTVINGGYLMEPYVVSEVTSQSGGILLNHGRVTKRQVLATSIANAVRSDLKKVVDEGTGTSAYISGYNIGGKTGTGQKFIEGTSERVEDLYAVSFMGFAPVDNPQVVALIVFDDLPEHTGAPASAFKDMMTKIFPYLEIETSEEATVEGEETVVVPAVTNQTIYEAVDLLKAKGLSYTIKGNGVNVTEQYPPAQSEWAKQGNVVLYTRTDDPGNLVEVPDLIGKTVEEAKEIVGDQLSVEGSATGVIQSQIPIAGCKIEKNNKVIIETTE
ncbi:MAG: PASTA domain-containing protein [Cellulosilyticum sp.]|nr:PASTA domain-containing protein [Cellulosilyticum sp.]